ncbi:MAG TPA: AzlC family ABC transporter permease [Thermoleophilaceae bacterium]|nr:AzlC family ABC transporter permease [Thermoleophilaceae bacterium]
MEGDERRARVGAAARRTAPLGVAVFFVAMSFGVTARPVIGAEEAIVMSVIVFAGSAQFAAVSVLAGGGGPGAAILSGVLLNLRFLAMGIAIGPWLRGGRVRRALQGQAIVDASFGLASMGDGRFDRHALIGGTLAQYPAWVLGTVAGVLAGDLVDDPEALGLDALFPAFFLVLLVDELRDGSAVVAAVLGAAIAAALVPLTPAGIPIVAASAAALTGLLRR